ncbi:MAG: aminotransferase class I/II-fold pyridoxal phosphate-dependent enzyme [Thermoplasmata archaeon]|nr:aminotransferase class I/II-fold pyridoxal phosphate-dependent enzyme [Thermoplasmata archaeon]
MRDWAAARTKRLEISGIRKMFELAKPGTINLGIGELDFEPIDEAKQALATAVNSGHNGYGPTKGMPELRDSIAESLHTYRKDVTRENVMITAGATQGLLVSAMALFDHGDEILIPDPGFVLYSPHAIMCGAFPVKYSLRQEHEFVPQPDEILELINTRTKAIILNTPNNPTSGVIDKDTIKAIRDIAIDHDLVIISDEVYDKIVYDDEHHSFLNGDYDNVVYINSFSKSFAMTGWRVGYMASSEELIADLSKIQYYNIACPPTPLQFACQKAMEAPDNKIEERVNILRKRRNVIVDRINKIDGFTCLKPNGAFYAFPSFDHDILGMDFAMKLLEGGMICAPGSAFGHGGEGHLRFSYANSIENIEKGMDILEEVASGIPLK